MFIQQRQHQETRESPHCCWWKQERVGDCVAGGRRGEWRQGEREREGERNSLSDSNLGTCTFYDFPAFGKTHRLLGANQRRLLPSKGVCVREKESLFAYLSICMYAGHLQGQHETTVNLVFT